MKIAIIGTGNVGSALAKGWVNAGHQIALGVRDQTSFKGMELVNYSPQIKVMSIAQSVVYADVVVIAATPQAVHQIVNDMGDVSQKILIDTMNSFRISPEGYTNTTEAFMALTNCNDIVKCFNTTGAENMFDPVYQHTGIDMFMSGNSDKAKSMAEKLAKDLGFENCYNFGDSSKFNLQEQLGLSWVNLAVMQGNGRNIAFKIVKK